MLILIGYFIVVASVFGGYMLIGGHLGALYQPAEIVMIAGAALGAFVASNNGKALKATLRTFSKLKRTTKYNKAMYMELMALQYKLLTKARRDGMLGIERDIDDPQNSAIFAEYPKLLADPMIMAFITDYLRLM
ncbi:MAG: motility-associated protein, partial [Halomonas sp.]|nr:motility-associated protein [Halomonas sp.]